MKKVTAACACITAAFLALNTCAPFAASSDAESMVSSAAESMASSAAESMASSNAESTASFDAESGSSGIVDDAVNAVENIDVEAVKENLNVVLKVISSEDFQSLLSYKEVTELIATIFEKAANFVQTEPELTKKIMITAGLDERYAGPVMMAINAIISGGEKVESEMNSDEVQQAVAIANKMLTDPDVRELLNQITDALEVVVK